MDVAADAAVMVYKVALTYAIWYSPEMVRPPTAVAPVYVTKSLLMKPPVASVTVTVVEPLTVANGLVSVRTVWVGVMS